MRDLENKVIVVTGGTSGIGQEVVLRSAEAGAKVAALGTNLEAGQRLAAEIPNVKAYQADVTSHEQMHDVCVQVVEDFGSLDGAVNNAGIAGAFAPIADCTPENWNAVLNVNLTGVFNSVKAELPHMLSASGGAIVNMASLSGILAEPMLPAYVASKHAVVGLTKAVAVDHGLQGIRCNAVCPTFVRTPLTEPMFQDAALMEQINARHPMGRTVTVDEVADICVFLLSDRSSSMTGSVHLADGGAVAM